MELATLSSCAGTIHRRLHGHCGDIPPAEYEKTFYATEQGEQALVEIKCGQSLHQTQGDSIVRFVVLEKTL